jgi:hypothetical protein
MSPLPRVALSPVRTDSGAIDTYSLVSEPQIYVIVLSSSSQAHNLCFRSLNGETAIGVR